MELESRHDKNDLDKKTIDEILNQIIIIMQELDRKLDMKVRSNKS
jgi:hypothetical protein